ncbi:hypothetical protein Vi05172_g10313 [Venturia inaequalis]|nr:hypothetical protein Vi05172_g10313 [Venturia inaequalis]
MYFTPYLLSTLLATAPALALDSKSLECTHFTTTYLVPCRDNKCKVGKMDDYLYAFAKNEQAFKLWIGKDGNGGGCAGNCEEIKLTEMPGGIGSTYTMRCWAARMKKKWETGIPGYLEGLERIWTARKCDVSCSPNGSGWRFSGAQSCTFKFDKCS